MAKRRKPNGGGYCDPPKSSQFKPGHSGNPGGRPKGSTSFAAAVRAEGDELVTLTVNGRPVRRTKRQFAAQVAWAEALKGNHKLLEMINKIECDLPSDEVNGVPAEMAKGFWVPTVDGIPTMPVTVELEEPLPPHIQARQTALIMRFPNYDPDRPMEEWGPEDPDSDH